MRKNTILNSIKVCGVTAVAFGFLTFNSGQAAAEEDELGNRLLYQGKAHEHVGELKELLAEHELLHIEEFSNEYDKQTMEAVREFQEEYNLIVDGLAGVQTLGALSGLEKGDEGVLVVNLQEDLAALGYYDFAIDGIFGPITENAVVGLQEDYNVEEDETGVAGPHTFGALHEATLANRTAGNSTSNAASSQSSSASDSSSNEETQTDNSSAEEAESGNSSEEESESNNSSTEESQASSESASSEGEEVVMTMEATAYTAYCDGCTGITFTGQDLRANPDKKVVAVDPNVIPLGSIVHVEGYGEAIAGDIGGAIKGNRIDLHMATKEEAIQFGRRDVVVTIIETP
jgi:3D (Asp-Asp-Asp) domain-containing protein